MASVIILAIGSLYVYFLVIFHKRLHNYFLGYIEIQSSLQHFQTPDLIWRKQTSTLEWKILSCYTIQ